MYRDTPSCEQCEAPEKWEIRIVSTINSFELILDHISGQASVSISVASDPKNEQTEMLENDIENAFKQRLGFFPSTAVVKAAIDFLSQF
jgi:hypothetical protein